MSYLGLFFCLILNVLLIFYLIKRDKSVLSYKLDSPLVISLYGILLFYVFPVFYWLIFEWPYEQNSYLQNNFSVQIAIFLFTLPAIFYPSNLNIKMQNKDFEINNLSFFVALLVSITVVLNSFYETFFLGNQGRLEFDYYEADSANYFFSNILKDYGTFFLFLLFLGKGNFKLIISKVLLFLYFIAIAFSFHRFAILIFFFQSFVFFVTLGKITLKPTKLIAYSIIGLVLIVGVVGRFGLEAISYVASNGLKNGNSLNFQDIYNISIQMVENFNLQKSPSLWDEVFLRLNQSRSAAAVMASYSEHNNFLFGGTFLSLFYFFIPRVIFPNKPNMAEVHGITVKFMGEDFGGVNPLGTIAESYINFGFWGIPVLALFFYLIIFLVSVLILKKGSFYFIAFYPYMAFMMFAFDLNLSQRMVQLFKSLLFYFILQGLFSVINKKHKIDNKI